MGEREENLTLWWGAGRGRKDLGREGCSLASNNRTLLVLSQRLATKSGDCKGESLRKGRGGGGTLYLRGRILIFWGGRVILTVGPN